MKKSLKEKLQGEKSLFLKQKGRNNKKDMAEWPDDRSKPPKDSLNHLTTNARLECMSIVREIHVDNRGSRLRNAHSVQELAEVTHSCILNKLSGKGAFIKKNDLPYLAIPPIKRKWNSMIPPFRRGGIW